MGYGPADWTTNEYNSANPYVDETFNGASSILWSNFFGDPTSVSIVNTLDAGQYSFPQWSKTFPSAKIWNEG